MKELKVLGLREGSYNKYGPKGPVELEMEEEIAFAKTAGCALCGTRERLGFQHCSLEAKKFQITDTPHGVTIARLRNELLKCVVICARCQRRIHEETPPASYITNKPLFLVLQKIVAPKPKEIGPK